MNSTEQEQKQEPESKNDNPLNLLAEPFTCQGSTFTLVMERGRATLKREGRPQIWFRKETDALAVFKLLKEFKLKQISQPEEK